jgi:hypothetical protein
MGLPRRSVRWRAISELGLEHLTLKQGEHGPIARGVVIGQRGNRAYGVHYEVACGADWAVRQLDVETTDGARIALRSDGRGHWTDEAGTPLAAFEGCIDIDLAGTPFTNTLPIRRWDWTLNEPVEFTMLYVPFDSFAPVIDRQRYTCLRKGRLFRYQAAERNFEVELPIDEDGLVIDYPRRFERIL